MAGASVALLLAACGGGGGGGGSLAPASYTVGGTLTGLAAKESVTLVNNGSDALTLSNSGSFTFSQPLTQGGNYSVAVSLQPVGQKCVVSNGNGSGASANVATVQVTCGNLPQYAYVVNNGDQTIIQYSISASGALTPLSPSTIATGNSPRSVTIDPSHHYVYVANLNDDTVSQYVIQQDGTLASNSPATVATGRGPWAVEFNPQGRFAYVVNSEDATISQYSVGANGTLEALAITPVATGIGPWNITLSPNGNYAYVSNYGITPATPVNSTYIGNTVSQYAIAPDTGELSPLTPATVASGTFPGGDAVDATNSFAYSTSIGDNTVWQYSIGSRGALTPLTPSFVSAGSEPDYIAIHPNNKYAYVVNFNNPSSAIGPGSISQYDIGTNGQLTPMANPSVPAGDGAGWLAFDTFGQFLYVANSNDGTVSQYSIGSDGSLSSLGVVSAGASVNTFEIAVTYIGP